MDNILISADGNKLIVRPGINKQQKAIQPISNNLLHKKKPITNEPVVMKVNKVTPHHHLGEDFDDDDDVWDDELLPKNSCYNGDHASKGIMNGVATLEVNDDSGVSLREMFVSEVNVCLHFLL